LATWRDKLDQMKLLCDASQQDVSGLQIPVERPSHLETTSLGAAFAAGIGIGFWSKEWVLNAKKGAFDSKQAGSPRGQTWQPNIDKDTNCSQYAKWKKAVALSYDLADLAEPDRAPPPAS